MKLIAALMFLCVGFCTGHFVMGLLNLTCLHCLQHSFFEHLFNLYYYITLYSDIGGGPGGDTICYKELQDRRAVCEYRREMGLRSGAAVPGG